MSNVFDKLKVGLLPHVLITMTLMIQVISMPSSSETLQYSTVIRFIVLFKQQSIFSRFIKSISISKHFKAL